MGDIFITTQKIFKSDGKIRLVLNTDLPRESIALTSAPCPSAATEKQNAKAKKRKSKSPDIGAFVAFYDNIYLQILDFCENHLLKLIVAKGENSFYKLKLSLTPLKTDGELMLVRRTLTLSQLGRAIYTSYDEDAFINGILRLKRVKKKAKNKRLP